MRKSESRSIGPFLLMACVACQASPDQSTSAEVGGIASQLAPVMDAWSQAIAAEDARGNGPSGITPITEATRSENARLRAIAVRGLGRLERPDLADSIVPLLADPEADVRAEAANALGQAVMRSDPATVRTRLTDALETESDAQVRGVIGETLGRLALPTIPGGRGRGGGAQAGRAGRGSAGTEAAEVAETTASTLAAMAGGADVDAQLGAVRGLYFLARQPAGRAAVLQLAGEALRALATSVDPPVDPRGGRVRRMAVSTLVAAGESSLELLVGWLQSDDAQIRREAATAIPRLDTGPDRTRLTESALADVAFAVRYEGLRVAGSGGRGGGAGPSCEPPLNALHDENPNMTLLAIDQLGACEPATAALAALDSIAGRADPIAWHPQAHAVAALSVRDAARAAPHVQSLAGHRNPFARAYAARVAATLGDEALLRSLAGDPVANVRTAAVEGLSERVGHGADDVYIDLLAQDAGAMAPGAGSANDVPQSGAGARARVEPDPQLMMAVAAALEGSPDPSAPIALLDALDRLTAGRWETSRDGRVALMGRIRELAGPSYVDRLRPYLRDFDPRIAELAADAIAGWTGTRPQPAPAPLPLVPVPSFDELTALQGASYVLEMEGGGEIVVRLFPFDAPTNAARFAHLAATGGYDGLTFHRVVPNFVVQGGSPGANEYSGAGRYSRDELGIEGNWRGTVGLSTRGRDTGDAQIYINLIDNIRLDHEYTTFGYVVSGMDVVDRLVEGARIARMRVE